MDKISRNLKPYFRNLMPESVLVTGGSGLLGINLSFFLKDKMKVTLACNQRRVIIKNVTTKVIDLGSIDEVTSVINSESIDLVINACGYTNIEKCESHPCIAKKVNVEIPANLAKACDLASIKLVHISTDHLFDGKECFYKETSPVSPQNVYAYTKHQGETKVLKICSNALVVRTNFFGWGPSYRASFSDFIINNLKNKMKIHLFSDVFFTPIAIGNLVLAMYDLISKDVSGIFNLVGEERISKYDFGIKLANAFNLDVKLINAIRIEDRIDLVKRPQDLSLSTDKVRTLLEQPLGRLQNQLDSLKNQYEIGFAEKIQNF